MNPSTFYKFSHRNKDYQTKYRHNKNDKNNKNNKNKHTFDLSKLIVKNKSHNSVEEKDENVVKIVIENKTSNNVTNNDLESKSDDNNHHHHHHEVLDKNPYIYTLKKE